MSARAGTYVLRQVTPQGRDFVCELPNLRHPNRVAELERQQAKAERSLQRKQRDDWRWARLQLNPFALPAAVERLRVRTARRSRVMYGRIAKMGGVR